MVWKISPDHPPCCFAWLRCFRLAEVAAGRCRCYTMRPAGFASRSRSACAYARSGPDGLASCLVLPCLVSGKVPDVGRAQDWNGLGTMESVGYKGFPKIPP